MRTDNTHSFSAEIQTCERGRHLRRVGTPVDRAHDEDGIVGGNVRQLLLDRRVADPFLCLFDAGVVVLCIGHGRLNLEHVCAGQLLHKFRDDLGVAFVDPADCIVLVGPAEIDDQALAHFRINLLSASLSSRLTYRSTVMCRSYFSRSAAMVAIMGDAWCASIAA